MNDESLTIKVEGIYSGMRLDLFLVAMLGVSRNRVHGMIASGLVIHATTKQIPDKNFKVVTGDVYLVLYPKVKLPEALNNPALNIVYEDAYLIVLNKPAGLTVHPGCGTTGNTLSELLDVNNGNSGLMRGGLVHRLDKDTSGLLLVARNEDVLSRLMTSFACREIKRFYLALVWGVPAGGRGMIDRNIRAKRCDRSHMQVVQWGGKSAITEYEVLEDFGVASLLQCKLHTGRTHQIRVHMSHLGHSVIGDQKYGCHRDKALRYAKHSEYIIKFPRQALQAYYMKFNHPITGCGIELQIPMEPDMQNLVNELKKL